MVAPGGYVMLEDGVRFDGELCAAEGSASSTARPSGADPVAGRSPIGRSHAVGEVVFTTGMSGYQESMTDPSFAGQLIAYTYPHIGNYGVSAEAMESERPWARAAIMREACNREDAPSAERGWLDWLSDAGVSAITGVDTRALVRHIRERGAMRGGVFGACIDEAQALELIKSEPAMAGQDLAAVVTPAEISHHGQGGGPRIAVIDTGIKGSMVRELTARGARVSLHPCTSSAAQLLAAEPDAIFLANGPGDPAALEYIVDTVRQLVGKKPVWGICLGHQLLCRAVGLDTFKLPFGHRGANHPVKDLQTGRVEITSQNHGFAAVGPDGARTIDVDQPVRWETDFGAAALSHVNLYDRTVEGLELLDVPGGTVQYHPEASPGPHDSRYLFDRFLERIAAA
jgi:carbamoyl-phosphate synthase small subunit